MDNKTCFETLVNQRQSIRAFISKPVEQALLEKLLTLAARAPSGTNTQPWQVYVVQGQKKQQIEQAVQSKIFEIRENPELKRLYQAAFNYYPNTWFEPYLGRRRENGWGLYGLLNIQKHEKEKMFQQQLRNFKFFDAPVGIFFVSHRELEVGSKMAIAMFMQNLMLAAKAYGLDTCAQAAWNDYHEIILPLLEAKPSEQLICGMALGYADQNALVNRFYTPRESVQSFAHFLY